MNSLRFTKSPGSLQNFWRSAENLQTGEAVGGIGTSRVFLVTRSLLKGKDLKGLLIRDPVLF